jgi:hypothetical protein
MDSRGLVAILGILALLSAGCMSLTQTPQAPQTQHLCDDGKTIVADLSACPVVDTQMQECDKSSTTADYNGDTERDACYYLLAVDRANASLCRKIHTTDSYATYTAGKCGAEIAINQGDPAVCESVGLVAKSDCYSEIAKQTSDISVCMKISSADKRDSCMYDYISVNYDRISDWSICGNMSSKSYDGSYCYETAAEQTHDVKYCDKLSYGVYGSKGSCYATIAKADRNPGLCDKLTGTDKDDCYYDYASTYPYDQSVCGKITDQSTKQTCNYYTNSSSYY